MAPNMTRTDGATGPLLSHNLRILFHMTRHWPAQVGHLATRWNLDWRLLASQNQHLSESTVLNSSLRHDLNAPWLERSW